MAPRACYLRFQHVTKPFSSVMRVRYRWRPRGGTSTFDASWSSSPSRRYRLATERFTQLLLGVATPYLTTHNAGSDYLAKTRHQFRASLLVPLFRALFFGGSCLLGIEIPRRGPRAALTPRLG